MFPLIIIDHHMGAQEAALQSNTVNENGIYIRSLPRLILAIFGPFTKVLGNLLAAIWVQMAQYTLKPPHPKWSRSNPEKILLNHFLTHKWALLPYPSTCLHCTTPWYQRGMGGLIGEKVPCKCSHCASFIRTRVSKAIHGSLTQQRKSTLESMHQKHTFKAGFCGILTPLKGSLSPRVVCKSY